MGGERGSEFKVQTDGINFEGVWGHADLVDVNAITTNDVAAMLHTYGVEVSGAAGAVCGTLLTGFHQAAAEAGSSAAASSVCAPGIELGVMAVYYYAARVNLDWNCC